MLLVGLVLVGTSYFGWCPAYSGFNKNTLCAADVVNEVVEKVEEAVEAEKE
jgi:hypothetical protein